MLFYMFSTHTCLHFPFCPIARRFILFFFLYIYIGNKLTNSYYYTLFLIYELMLDLVVGYGLVGYEVLGVKRLKSSGKVNVKPCLNNTELLTHSSVHSV